MASAEGLRRAVKGLSEAEFRERFGTEEACREALFAMRWREGLTCPACGGRGFCELRTRKLFQCNRCKRQVRLTAGHRVPGQQAAARRPGSRPSTT
jgi:hypothetical protein